jgi:HPt (histidine-containing phosphotransfer) domain-containing protein
MNGDRERCIPTEKDGYLSKPIRSQELDQTLNPILTRKQSLPAEGNPIPTLNNSVEVFQLLDRIEDDRSLLAELIEIFRREYPENLQAAQRAIELQNPEDLQRAGHTLRGALGNLSATSASALAAELEAAGRKKDLIGTQAIFDKLVPELSNVIRALEALCPVVAQ